MPRRQLIAPLAVVLASGACSTFKIPRYGLSAEDVVALRKLGQKVSVGAFTAVPPGRSEIGCRSRGPVRTADERPFEDHVRRALIDELFSDSAPVTLTGSLGKLDFNSMKGQWLMDMSVASSNGRSLAVSTVYEYSTGPVFNFTQFGSQSTADQRACAETAQAFPGAVPVLTGKFVHDSQFATLLQ